MNTQRSTTVTPQTSENLAHIVSFAERVFSFFSHAEGRDDLNTPGHVPNWKDSPARFRSYPGLASIPLPAPEVCFGRLKNGTSGLQPTKDSAEIDRLCLLLYLAFAPLRRQLGLNWNYLHMQGLTSFRGQDFARGTASGGGLYPTQCYLVEGSGTALRSGLYHYSNGTHALTPLRLGDTTRALAEALGSDLLHTRYLVLTSDFWRNCFKYDNFGYHVCTQDIGAAIGMLEIAADVLRLPVKLSVHFCDERVNALLGLNGIDESAFAVFALGEHVRDLHSTPPNASDETPVPAPWQRSRRARIPAGLTRVHRATMRTKIELAPQTSKTERSEQNGYAPQESAAEMPSNSNSIDRQLHRSLVDVLHRRRSSWSSMGGAPPLPVTSLLEVLRFMHDGSATSSSIGNVRLCLRAGNIAGLAPGGYDWDASAGRFLPRSIEHVANWQQTYAMDNYNIDEAAAVLFVVGDLSSALRSCGADGYRLLNFQVGRLAQRAYLGAAALGLAAGVALGVRAIPVKRILQLPDSENVFLAIYLGPAQPAVELFNFRLIQATPVHESTL